MLRIDPSIALDVELNGNGTGKHGFQPGDPQTGREPTQVPYQWLNMLQEELANLLEGCGVALDAARTDQLLGLLKPSIAVPGMVSLFAGQTAPQGWLKANGALVSRTSYARLFAAIGTTYGAGDGSTTFKLPDLRGEFLRGWDDARGVDAGRVFGSWQDSQNKSHGHSGGIGAAGDHGHTAWTDTQGYHAHNVLVFKANDFNSGSHVTGTDDTYDGGAWVQGTDGAGNHAHNVGIGVNGNHSHTLTIDANGGTESRPRNVAMLACIKF